MRIACLLSKPPLLAKAAMAESAKSNTSVISSVIVLLPLLPSFASIEIVSMSSNTSPKEVKSTVPSTERTSPRLSCARRSTCPAVHR